MSLGFTKKEASLLSGLSINQIDYLYRNKIVEPLKVADSRVASVLYSWNQVIELKIISELKKRKTPLKWVYAIAQIAKHNSIDWSNFERTIAVVESPIEGLGFGFFGGIDEEILLKTFQLPGQNCYILFDAEDIRKWIEQILAQGICVTPCYIPPIGNICEDLKKTAKENSIRFEDLVPSAAQQK